MKHIKLFEKFKLNENEKKEINPKMFISKDGVLTIKDSDTAQKIKMEDADETGDSSDGSLVIKTAADQTASADNRIFKCDVWRASYGKVKEAYAELGWNLEVNDLGNTREETLYLYVATPENYSGEITGKSDVIGKTTSARRISGKGKSTWGFYNMDELKSTSTSTIPAFKNITLFKGDKQVAAAEKFEKISIKDGFEYDSFELSNSAKEEIKKKLEPIKDKIRGVWITTGASQDNDPNEEIEKKGKTIKRSEWDSYLVKNRYNVLGKYLKDLGIQPKVSKAGKKDDGGFKVYGVFDENLKSEQNRTILIKPVYK